MTVNTKPMKIPGRWRDGYALDYHTVSSTYLGHDEFGHPQFETTRSEVGELLYQLKYRADESVVAALADTCATFLQRWSPGVEVIVPVPPSKARAIQPVILVATALATHANLPVAAGSVTRNRETPELKNVYEYDARVRLLTGAHTIGAEEIKGRKVLLFDDLYRSGATMNAITDSLYDHGAAEVFALTITRTRSNQ